VSLVSHELRTPLTSILGYLELLADGDYGPLTQRQLAGLGVVRASSDRLLKLVDDLLDVSRIRAGAVALKLRPVELGPLLGHVAMSMGPQFEAKMQRLDVHVPTDLPPVQADADRLMQIVTNLLSNATKYTPRGGAIDVVAAADGDRVRVEVRDSGIGIPVHEQDKIFERFYRSASTASRRQSGSGLGLAITQGLVEAQGGEIWVHSAPGEGSTFAFSLPASAATPALARASGLRSTAVLVVSGTEDVIEGLRLDLGGSGIQTLGATTAGDAIELARLESPGLVLIDVMLPDCVMLLRDLTLDPTTSATPAALLSVVPGEEDAPRYASVGRIDAGSDLARLRLVLAKVFVEADRRLMVVVDCDQHARRAITDIASEAGCRVEFCAGDEAVPAVRDGHAGVVLVAGPGPDDREVELVGRLRSDPATSQIPLLLLVDGVGGQGQGSTAADLLPVRPVDADELAEAVARTVAVSK
jgi:CheY-like chemotaxis protein